MWPDPSVDGDKSLRVLIVGSDPALEEEFRSALSRIPDRKGTVHSVDTYRDALDAARRRQPNLILIEIDRATSEITTLSRDLQGLVPDAAIAAAFKPDRVDHGQSEGTMLIELLRAHVRDFLRRPLAATELRGVIDRLFTRRSAAGAHGRVAAFLSNKGGLGQST